MNRDNVPYRKHAHSLARAVGGVKSFFHTLDKSRRSRVVLRIKDRDENATARREFSACRRRYDFRKPRLNLFGKRARIALKPRENALRGNKLGGLYIAIPDARYLNPADSRDS